MLFSIITPSFKQLDWLRLCIASVADQVEGEKAAVGGTLQQSAINNSESPLEIEHIVQDAGSPGIEAFARELGTILQEKYGGEQSSGLQTFELLHFHTPSGYTLRIFKEPDAGMYDAINKGLERASGEICAWLNCDEQYLEGTLQKVAFYFSQKNPIDVLLGDALLTDEKHRPVCYRKIMVPGRWHTRLDHLHSLSCAMFFRKRSLPFPPLDSRWKVIGDAVLMDYFLRSKMKIRSCGTLLAAYAFTGANLSANPTHREHALWLEEIKWPPGYVRPLVVLQNRLRRMVHGAYNVFKVDVGLFTRDSPQSRLHVNGILSGKWPKTTDFSQGNL